MTKEELLQYLAPFSGELDLVIEHEGAYYSIDSLSYVIVSSNGMGIVMLGSGENAGRFKFSRTKELL